MFRNAGTVIVLGTFGMDGTRKGSGVGVGCPPRLRFRPHQRAMGASEVRARECSSYAIRGCLDQGSATGREPFCSANPMEDVVAMAIASLEKGVDGPGPFSGQWHECSAFGRC